MEFRGTKELSEALLKKANLEAVRKIVRQNGAELQSKAQRKAPVANGDLMGSIGLDVTDLGLTAEVEPTVEYAAYQEYGTRFMEAQPYMKPAFNEQKEQFKKDLDNLVK